MYFSDKLPQRTLRFQNCFLENRHQTQTWEFQQGLLTIICTYTKYAASQIIMLTTLSALSALPSPFILDACA